MKVGTDKMKVVYVSCKQLIIGCLPEVGRVEMGRCSFQKPSKIAHSRFEWAILIFADLQSLLSYGVPRDQPRNLAKSVTAKKPSHKETPLNLRHLISKLRESAAPAEKIDSTEDRRGPQ
jgi:hypothetical protein